MSKPELMYNMHLLSNITDLNVEEGLRQSGSRRDYFNALTSFEGNVRHILGRLPAERPPKELMADLNELLQKLMAICDTSISTEIEKTLILVKRGGNRKIATEKLYRIQKETLLLIKMIEKSVTIAPTENADQEADSDKTRPKSHRLKMTPSPLVFSTLIKHLENFDADAAFDELTTISSFSYGNEIDKALERIAKHLANFEYEKNEAEIKTILSLVSEDEQLDKKAEKKKILAIDDMPDILNTIKSLLKEDFNVYCVTNHLAAFKFLANNTPDLILIDIEMPEMDGFTLVKILRQMETCKQTPVLFITSNVSVENVKTSIESGGNDFIKKPIDYKTMVNKIQRHLNKNSSDA